MLHRSKLLLLTSAIALSLAVSCGAHAQTPPDTDNGRYTLSPVAGDFLRLDTRTGVVSICSNNGGWACRVVPDERTALDSEIGKLQSDNQKLKDKLAQRDVPSGTAETSPDAKIEFQFQADQQKLMALIDRMWDRLVEMANQVQKKLSEKI